MSYIIAFKDKSKLQIEDHMAKVLMEAILEGEIKNFELGGELYSVSGIDKIVSKQRAYDIFPTDWEYLQTLEDIKPQRQEALLSSGEGVVK